MVRRQLRIADREMNQLVGRSVPDRRIELPGSTEVIVHRRFGTNRPTIPQLKAIQCTAICPRA
jgi:hypothetical protein